MDDGGLDSKRSSSGGVAKKAQLKREKGSRKVIAPFYVQMGLFLQNNNICKRLELHMILHMYRGAEVYRQCLTSPRLPPHIQTLCSEGANVSPLR
jgi:hypothetical protein